MRRTAQATRAMRARARVCGRRRRLGFALVELLAALAVTALLGTAIVRLLDRSRRFALGVAALADQRAQLAVAAFALEGALAGVAAGDGDLLAGSDSSVAYQASIGSALACQVGANTIDVADVRLASGATLTWWNTAPQPGDSLAILDEGTTSGRSDDRWHHAALAAVGARPAACRYTPYLDSIADAATVGWRLATTTPLPPTITPGSIVRITRPERFALYRSSGEWMLGWTEWQHAAFAWNAIQPVAGPLLPHAPPGATSGFAIQWLDSLGNALVPAPGAPARAARLSLAATTRVAVRMDGLARAPRRDSLVIRLALRNAP